MGKLKTVVDSLDGLDDSIQQFYSEGTGALEGRYVLSTETVDGIGIEDVGGLRKALDAERKRARDLERAAKAVKGYEELFPNGLDEAREMRSKLDAGEFDSAKEQQIAEKYKRDLEARIKAATSPLEEQLTGTKTALEKREAQLRRTLVDAHINAAIGKAGGDPLLAKLLRDNFQIAESEDGELGVQVVNDSGDPLYQQGSDGRQAAMDPAAFVESLKMDERYGRFFAAASPDTPRGPQAQPRGQAGHTGRTGASIRLTRDQAKDPKHYHAAVERANQLGATVEVIE
jgi:hypothetical protein